MISKCLVGFLIVNSLSFLLHCTAEIDENMKAVVKMIHDECVSESGISVETIDRIFATKTMEPDPNYKCYLKCTLQQISAMDDEGNVDKEVFIGTMPEEYRPYAIEVSEKCKTVKGSDACEIAYNLNVCAQKVDPSKYVFI